MKCPRCGLISPEGSRKCDCGYELNLPRDMQAHEMRTRPERASGPRRAAVIVCAIIAAVWIVYIAKWDSTNNLYGMGLVFLIPISAVVLIVSGIFWFGARR